MKKYLNIDLGLLLFRVIVAVMLYINHGHEKLFHFEEMLIKIPDPLHIGKLPGLILATFSDVFCAFLIFFGYRIKLAAMVIATNTMAAFILVQHMEVTSLRGEIALLYFSCFLCLSFSGPGSYSLDRMKG